MARAWQRIVIALTTANIFGFVPVNAAGQPNDEIVVRAHIGRIEIERILAADNLDTLHLNPSEIADRMAAIQRGRAPDDFWQAYQRHVDAWQRFRDALTNPMTDTNERIAAER